MTKTRHTNWGACSWFGHSWVPHQPAFQGMLCLHLTYTTTRDTSRTQRAKTWFFSNACGLIVHANVKEDSLYYKISSLWKTGLQASHFFPALYSDRETSIYKVDSIARGKEAGGRWQGSPCPSLPSADCPLASPPRSEWQSRHHHPFTAAISSQ